ncbi:RNA methyltransferase [Paenibacillus puldeungensis]|uniref:RNA methyltransferase n=1 Tax=Paenibacillus puldeungensis TaxID=696536 RepID=A0ABW3S4B5_9BACL
MKIDAGRGGPEALTDNSIYFYACHENDVELCHMELRALFGHNPESSAFIESSRKVEPNRSPFISMRLDVLFRVNSIEELVLNVKAVRLEEKTFKVVYMKSGTKRSYEEQRELERLIGGHITGKVDVHKPHVMFGLFSNGDTWVFGVCHSGEAVWLKHKDKPQNYSTGLSTYVARALVNIAVPETAGIKAIDPCCGMGNVLIEALSMGIDIVGRDINPLAIKGARVNLRHFGYCDPDLVVIGDMNEIEERYDAAIIDMPYNLCSVLSPEERVRMLNSLQRFSNRSVIVSSERLEKDIAAAGLAIADQCTLTKGSFVRNVWLT